MKTKSYDIVVIGAGSGGLTAAVGGAKVGKKVLLIEQEHMGGECTNSGCVPSKALLHVAKQYYESKEVAGMGAKSEAFRTEALPYVRETIQKFLQHETPETFEKMGIDVVIGEAIFNTKCSVKVKVNAEGREDALGYKVNAEGREDALGYKVNAEGREDALGYRETIYQYKTAIIATGSSPRLISISGLDKSQLLTNQNLFELESIPEKTLIIGAGPIGLEMGQALSMLGSMVTIATIDSEFARLEDTSIRPILKQTFDKAGVHINLNVHINRVEDSVAIFDIKNGDRIVDEIRIPFDKILVAIGRTPNLPNGLEEAEIKYDERCILVDDQFRTSNKYVYAIGDVSQKFKFTHTADDSARQIITRIVSRGLLRINNKKAIPKVTYTYPEIAQVGLSWEKAKLKYQEKQLMRIEVPFSQNDRAITDDATDGLLVVIVRRLNGAVLGAHIMGPRAGEIISLFTLAIDEKISMWRFQKLIFPYPSYSLIVKKAADQFFARQLANLKNDIFDLIKRGAPKIIAGIFWVTLIYFFQRYRITNDLSYQDVLFQLLDFFTTTMWGPVVYMILYAVRPLILFPATLLTALSGALFGFWWGIIYTIIGENASANFAYWIGRFFGKDLRLEDSAIGNWVEALRKNSFETVLLMRLFYVPFDLTNYGSGIVQAKWREYFFATLIGIMPGLTTFVALGAAVDLEEFRTVGLSFDAFDPKYLALSVVIFIISLFLSRFLKRWKAEQ